MIAGSLTAITALFINQLLWTVTHLAFGPGVIIGIFSPILIGTLGVMIGLKLMDGYDKKMGIYIILLNIILTIIGLGWSLVLQPRLFGPDPVPV